jgi:hypothetical protein
MEETLCQLYIRRWTENQNIHGAQKTKFPKNNDPMKKWANELNRTFSYEEIEITVKHMKKCSPFLAIKEMQIKTTLRFHFTPVWITTIKNTNNKKFLLECGAKGTLIHYKWECKLVQQLWKTIWRLLKKLKLDLLYNPAIPLLGIYLKECESGCHKDTCISMFVAALLMIVKLLKQPHYWWMD